MSQLINFIPKTKEECRRLLKDLSESREGAAVADRYGNIDALNAEEVKALIDLIENQIGEPAPAPAKKPEPSEDSLERTCASEVCAYRGKGVCSFKVGMYCPMYTEKPADKAPVKKTTKKTAKK